MSMRTWVRAIGDMRREECRGGATKGLSKKGGRKRRDYRRFQPTMYNPRGEARGRYNSAVRARPGRERSNPRRGAVRRTDARQAVLELFGVGEIASRAAL